jgi:signal transduction histidine kinase
VGNERRGLWSHLRERAGTVRVRTTAAAAIVVGVALIVAAIAMVALLRRSLTDDVRAAARVRADAVEELLTAGTSSTTIRVGDEEEEFVQVLDPQGQVVASSANLAGSNAVARLEPGQSRELDDVAFEDDPFLVLATSASAPEGPRTILVGRTLETVTESSQVVVNLLATGLPLLLLVVTVTTWSVVGRALSPMEAIRAEVDAISTRELHRRVSDPPGKDEVARLAATMNRMLARLEAGQTRQRRFVSDASHELRSPVATIRQHAEVALSHPDGTSIEDLAGVVLEEDARLQRLVEDLLLLAKMDEGTLRLRTESVDLDDIVFEEAERLRASMDLRVDSSRVSAGRVSGDRGQLARLVRNLTDNAARHADSTVALALREGDGEVVLTIDDDGDGIPEPERERIFERFVRLEEARDRDSGGSGLGLAIVAEIAGAHGARVAVRDGPAGGARLEVRFPSEG